MGALHTPNHARADHESGRGLFSIRSAAFLYRSSAAGGLCRASPGPSRASHPLSVAQPRWRTNSRVGCRASGSCRRRKIPGSRGHLCDWRAAYSDVTPPVSQGYQTGSFARMSVRLRRALRLRSELLAARKVLAHTPQQLFGLRIDPRRLRMARLGPSGQDQHCQSDY